MLECTNGHASIQGMEKYKKYADKLVGTCQGRGTLSRRKTLTRIGSVRWNMNVDGMLTEDEVKKVATEMITKRILALLVQRLPPGWCPAQSFFPQLHQPSYHALISSTALPRDYMMFLFCSTRSNTGERRMMRADGDGSCRRRASGEGRRGHQADLQDRDAFIRIFFVLRVMENEGWDLGLTLFKIVVLLGACPSTATRYLWLLL